MPLGSVVLRGGVLYENCGVTKLITLSREKALNALNLTMVQDLQALYNRFRLEGSPFAIVLKGAGTKAFCAGGDVVTLVKNEPAGIRSHFFKEEYALNYMIGSFQETGGVPHVSLLDGIVMGGGVGLSVHGSMRVCSEATLFAMPECAIGLFPDVGGSIFLPHLAFPGLGEYLALTGRRLKGADVVLSGLGTHYVPHAKIPALTEALTTATCVKHIPTIVDSFAVPVEKKSFSHLTPDGLKLIEEAFAYPKCIEDVLTVLQKSLSQKELATQIIQEVKKGSPTSVKVTLEQLRRGKEQTRAENFKMEYRLSQSFMKLTQDFDTGVRAVLIDKTGAPKWSPTTLEEVSQEYVQSFFETVPESGDLIL